MVRNGALSHKIDYITIFTGSRVTAILLNGLIFPICQSGEASWWRVCYQRSLPGLVLIKIAIGRPV